MCTHAPDRRDLRAEGEDRLDLQRGSHHRLSRSDPPAAAQVLERVQAEPDVEALAGRVNGIHDARRARPPCAATLAASTTRQPRPPAPVALSMTSTRAEPSFSAAIRAASRALSQVPDSPPAMCSERHRVRPRRSGSYRPGSRRRTVARSSAAAGSHAAAHRTRRGLGTRARVADPPPSRRTG